MRRLVGRIAQTFSVIIPVKVAVRLPADIVQQSRLALAEGVLAHDHDAPVERQRLRHGGSVAKEHGLRHIALQHPLVGDTASAQGLIEGDVKVFQHLPHPQKLGFLGRIPARDHHSPETLQGIFLIFGEKLVTAVQLAQVADVGEQFGVVGHVLVHIVEVGQDGLPQRHEIVETLRFAPPCLADVGITPPQYVQQLDLIATPKGSEPGEQIADGHYVGREDRAAAALSQIFLEEKRRTPRREHEQALPQIHITLCGINLGYLI